MTTIAADLRSRTLLPSMSPGSSEAYLEVSKSLDSARNRVLQAASTLQSRSAATLARLASECFAEGWDGYAAKPITAATCDRVQAFIDALPSWMAPPDIVPETDGEIAVEWDFGPHQIFSVSIGEKGPVHFAGLFGLNKERHGAEPFQDSVPEDIFSYISQLLRAASPRRAA